MRCNHGWNLPAEVECPECLWQEAIQPRNRTPQATIAIVVKAVENAALCVPEADRDTIHRIAKSQNNWFAIREAKRKNVQKREGLTNPSALDYNTND